MQNVLSIFSAQHSKVVVISIKVVGSTQTYTRELTRQDQGVVCIWVVANFHGCQKLVGTLNCLMQVINGHHPIIVSDNCGSAFNFQCMICTCDNAWFNSTCYHPPPGIPPGICNFFLTWRSIPHPRARRKRQFPTPGTPRRPQIRCFVYKM